MDNSGQIQPTVQSRVAENISVAYFSRAGPKNVINDSREYEKHAGHCAWCEHIRIPAVSFNNVAFRALRSTPFKSMRIEELIKNGLNSTRPQHGTIPSLEVPHFETIAFVQITVLWKLLLCDPPPQGA